MHLMNVMYVPNSEVHLITGVTVCTLQAMFDYEIILSRPWRIMPA